MRIFLLLSILLPCMFSQPVISQQLSLEESTSGYLVSNEEPEFLPVDQAYQFDLVLQNEKLRLHWLIAPGYYLYRQSLALKINGVAVEPLPLPEGLDKHDEFFGDVQVYYSGLTFKVDPGNFPAQLQITYQGCADAGLCYPPRERFFSIDNQGKLTETSQPEVINEKRNRIEPLAGNSPGFWVALVFAFIGGLLLNVMPCVFPILGLKLLAVAQSGHKQKHAWVYTAGVVSSFLALALVLAAIKSAGEQLGWGFQLQSPVFLWFLAYLFTVLGLNLSGLVYFGGRLMGIGESLTNRKGVAGDFFTGVLAVVVASPCSVPFMGAAMGYAMTQSTPVIMVIFAALGLGMALPFILVASIPGLQKLLPSPGSWMETFKQLLAFPLYLTVIWLLWVIGRQTDPNTMALALAGCLILGFCCWLVNFRNNFSRLVLLALLVMALVLPFKSPSSGENSTWQSYSPQLLDSALQNGQGVFINATADWCITCLSNELTTLDNENVLEHFRENNILLLKADWTRQDPEISDLLSRYQRTGVPLYLWFAPGKAQATVLPQILQPSTILELH